MTPKNTEPYQILSVPDEADLPEQLGTKEKYWFLVNNELCLFKLGRAGTGENWAEKVACELCELLGLPHAQYEFGIWKGQKGVISPTIVPPGGRLTLGNEQLEKAYIDYPREQVRGVSQHTLRRVAALMDPKRTRVLPPLNWKITADIETAVDVFVGYLLLDTWIGNTDRHHENWGFILTTDGNVHLAPTYDHASSLGCHETNENRRRRLETRDSGFNISSYIKKARSALYFDINHTKPLTTLDALHYLSVRRKLAAREWLERLANITADNCEQVFYKIPATEINDFEQTFALRVLELNKKRLLLLRDELK